MIKGMARSERTAKLNRLAACGGVLVLSILVVGGAFAQVDLVDQFDVQQEGPVPVQSGEQGGGAGEPATSLSEAGVNPSKPETNPSNLKASPEEPEPGPGDKIALLKAEYKKFREHRQELDNLSAPRRDALFFRHDERALEFLRVFINTSKEILKLPQGAPQREKLSAVYSDNAEPLEGIFLQAFATLSSRIKTKTEALDELSGVDEIAAEALLVGLNRQRIRYLELMIDFVSFRKEQGLPPGRLESIAASSLEEYSQELIGRLEVGDTTKRFIASRLARTPEDADLKKAMEVQRQQSALAIELLERVVIQMEHLALDTAAARKELLKQNNSVSVSMFDVGLLASLVEDFGSNVEEWLKSKALDVVFQILLFIVIIIGARFLARFTRAAVRRALDSKGSKISHLLQDVLISMAGLFVLTIGFLVALAQIGISLAPMLAGLGVAGFIIGFALQDTLGNFAAGAMILAYRPFDTDDYISVAGVEGFVSKMNLVSTTINTRDNQMLILPNSKIWGDVIRNYTGQSVRRVDLEFGISYGDDVEKAERILNEIVADNSMILATPEPIIRVHRLGESSVDFVVRPWVKTEDYWETLWALTKAVKIRFDAENVSIPFPQRDVHHFYGETAPPA